MADMLRLMAESQESEALLIFEKQKEHDGAVQKRPHPRRGMDPAAETVSKASALRGGEAK